MRSFQVDQFGKPLVEARRDTPQPQGIEIPPAFNRIAK